MPAITIEDDAPTGGAGRIARRLLAPVRAGGYLLAGGVAPLAAALEAPWRPSDTRFRLRYVIDTALARGKLDAVTSGLAPLVRSWRDRWRAARDAQPGACRIFDAWRLRAQATLAWLEQLGQAGSTPGPVTLVVASADRLATVSRHSALGGSR